MPAFLSGLLGRFGMVGGAAIGYGVGHGISPTIRPLVQDIANIAWQTHAVRPLDPQLAAQLAAEGLWAEDAASAEARLSGISDARFKRMMDEAQHGPSIGDALEGLRRGALDATRFKRALDQAGVRDEWKPFVTELARRLIGVDQLANMVIRGVIPLDQGAARAQQVGIHPDDFNLMVAVTGNPPGNDELLDLWNRGVIDEALVNRGLAQSNLKPEWFDHFKARRFFIPSVADLVRFAVREVFTPAIRSTYGLDDEFPQVFEQQGLLRGLAPEWARAYWAAHWELPSITQGYQMLWRGVISDSELDTLLRTKDVMPFWRGKLKQISYLVPGRVDLRRMLRAGVLTLEQVEQGYRRLGYNPADAKTLTTFAKAEKERTESGGDLISRFRRSVVLRIHKEYLEHSADEATARKLLESIGIPPETTDGVLPLWTVERDIFRRELTPSQLRAAYKAAQLTQAETLARLADAGYTDADAMVFLESLPDKAGTDPATALLDRTRRTTVERVHKEFVERSLDEAGARQALQTLAVEAATIDALIPLWTLERDIFRRELTPTQVRDAFKAELIPLEEAVQRLMASGMTSEDAAKFLAS